MQINPEFAITDTNCNSDCDCNLSVLTKDGESCIIKETALYVNSGKLFII